MPPNVNMELIREAMARRASATAAPTPAIRQVTQPGTPLPTGGPNVPVQSPPPVGQAPQRNLPPRQQPVNVARRAGQVAQSPIFEDDTRNIAKSLITNLMKYI